MWVALFWLSMIDNNGTFAFSCDSDSLSVIISRIVLALKSVTGFLKHAFPELIDKTCCNSLDVSLNQ